MRLTEDTTRTTYKPQVKILKRNPDGLPGGGDMAAASRYVFTPATLLYDYMLVFWHMVVKIC